MSLRRDMFGLPPYLRHADGNLAARSFGEGHRGIGDFGVFYERAEPRQLVGILAHALPLARIAFDVTGDRLLELLGQAQRVVAHDIAQVVKAAPVWLAEALHPWRGAL